MRMHLCSVDAPFQDFGNDLLSRTVATYSFHSHVWCQQAGLLLRGQAQHPKCPHSPDWHCFAHTVTALRKLKGLNVAATKLVVSTHQTGLMLCCTHILLLPCSKA
jgi:hypothetical protein